MKDKIKNIANGIIDKNNVDLAGLLLLEILGALFLVAYKSKWNEAGEILGFNYNYFSYFFTLLISFIIYVLLSKCSFGKRLNGVIGIAAMFFSLLYIFIMYREEANIIAGGNDNLLRDLIDHKVYSLLLLGCAGLMIYLMKSINEKTISDRKNVFRAFVSLLVAFVTAWLSYSLNIFKDEAGGLWHIHAYVNSIINVAHGVPYSNNAQSIYGHYGILYLPLVKLFGDDLKAVMLTVSLIVFLTTLVAMLIINTVVKNDLLFFVAGVAVLANETVYRAGGNYFQVFPHRVLFPIVAIGWVILKNKKQLGVFKYPLEILLGALAIMWNIETGVFAIVSIIAIDLFEEWQWKILVIVKRLCLFLAEIAVCFALSYCFTNLYNIAVGGEWLDVGTYIFPLATTSYMDGFLRTPMQSPVYWYVLYVFVFTCTLFPIISRQFFDEKYSFSLEEKIVISVDISGLLVLLYFINRQAFNNVTISYVQLVIVLAVMANRYFTKEDNLISADTIALLLICAMSVECVVSIGRTIDNRIATVWEIESLERDASNFKEWREEGVVSMGVGVPELYYFDGGDSQSAMTDWSDMWDYTYVDKVLSESDIVYINANDGIDLADMLHSNHLTRTRKFEGENIDINEFRRYE
ncbi:hypothetical protein [Pseudobutyrivibrio xylanivorans]|uniref:Chlor_Arch_YYY domain-containing protein n=1 Tax=Pseudobutyrivibrio xylanivorans TaxID=185007 RepID=A0A5P6VMR5_PSEXY|nr:hypothetical protein [Pseudobutyrivibrio xylanivorans]QFJ53945.1 hypothetical protein FXF36_03210 [Pseudobutyrivibrio xylanivorans]